MSDTRCKVAVLGAGPAGLAAAWELSRTAALRAKYAVTVYQLGWRIGGKVATGSNASRHGRSETHGPHMWSGFYLNAFTMLRDALDGGDLGSALVGRDTFCVADTTPSGRAFVWELDFPSNGSVPGDGAPLPTPLDYLSMLVQLMVGFFRQHDLAIAGLPSAPAPPRGDVAQRRLDAVRAAHGPAVHQPVDPDRGIGSAVPVGDHPSSQTPLGALLGELHALTLHLPADVARHHASTPEAVAGLCDEALGAACDALARCVDDVTLWRLFVLLSLGLAGARGIILDGVLWRGFEAIDDHDLRAWLRSHGAAEAALSAGPLSALYNMSFAFEGGDPGRPSVGAGTALRGALRQGLAYQGHVFYAAAGPFGDVVLAPIYRCLERRGVGFRFFHKVTGLAPTKDGADLDAITLIVQAQPRGGAYDPLLVDVVTGRDRWPSQPVYERLVDGDAMEAAGVETESTWGGTWSGESTRTLRRGEDFDTAVLAIPVSALATLAAPLAAVSPRLRVMLDTLRWTATASVELALRQTSAALGWSPAPTCSEPPLESGLAQPLNSWVDTSTLLQSEAWAGGNPTLSLAMGAGPWAPGALPPPTDRGFPSREQARLRGVLRDWLTAQGAKVWTAAVAPDRGFDWSVLVSEHAGPASVDEQYVRASVEPSEAYVLSLPGTAAARLAPESSGLGNVVLAGDWTRCGLDMGCVEAAVTSGRMAGRAVQGVDYDIAGAPALERCAGRRRVAVLGGGVSAMSSAYTLTQTAERRARFDVTVYQMGWRLGGKGASGRDAGAGQRIQEHGLHIFLGWYENAFKLLRECYAELDRPAGAPLREWTDAWKKHGYITFMDRLSGAGLSDDGWRAVQVQVPENTCVPGDGGEYPDLWAYLAMASQAVLFLIETTVEPFLPAPRLVDRLFTTFERAIEVAEAIAGGLFDPRDHARGIGTAAREAPRRPDLPGHALRTLGGLVSRALRLVAGGAGWVEHLLEALLGRLRREAWALLGAHVPTDVDAKLLWVVIDLFVAVALGCLRDRVPARGLAALDDVDLRDWARAHGANEETLSSGPVRNLYDGAFAFVHGDAGRPSIAASAALRGALRTFFAYKGAFMWEMQAGMGDVVFAPLYEVLTRRGVRFEFFHKVEALRLSPDANVVAAVEVTRQVRLSRPYEPLVDVGGLPCWPAAPRFELIAGGDELAASGIDLESHWAPRWRDAAPRTLRVGVDFDTVVLGISVGGLPFVAGDLMAADAGFAAMVRGVETMQTLGVQLWLRPTLDALGWRRAAGTRGGPVTSAFLDPLSTWADMSFLLERERWAGDDRPRCLAYFTGPFPDAEVIPPPTDTGFPARERARLREATRAHLDGGARWLWPHSRAPGSDRFDEALLVGGSLDSQWLRVNIDPSERYVLSTPGTARLRLRPRATRFQNLVLTGDWIDNGLNFGCVEGAVVAGLLSARAITGDEVAIIGE